MKVNLVWQVSPNLLRICAHAVRTSLLLPRYAIIIGINHNHKLVIAIALLKLTQQSEDSLG